MSIIERLLPVQETGSNFFDHVFAGMERDVAEIQADAARMRHMMCQLVPFNDKDVSTHEMQVVGCFSRLIKQSPRPLDQIQSMFYEDLRSRGGCKIFEKGGGGGNLE